VLQFSKHHRLTCWNLLDNDIPDLESEGDNFGEDSIDNDGEYLYVFD
jgi:hypothetical protein